MPVVSVTLALTLKSTTVPWTGHRYVLDLAIDSLSTTAHHLFFSLPLSCHLPICFCPYFLYWYTLYIHTCIYMYYLSTMSIYMCIHTTNTTPFPPHLTSPPSPTPPYAVPGSLWSMRPSPRYRSRRLWSQGPRQDHRYVPWLLLRWYRLLNQGPSWHYWFQLGS